MSLGEDLRIRITNLENSLAVLLSTAQMTPKEIKEYLDQEQNVELLQQSLQLAERGCSALKAQLYEVENQSQKAASELLNAKNEEVIRLQDRLSDTAKQLSNSQLEVAALKRSISLQEAQNAQLTIENLRLKSLIESKGLDDSHTNSVIDRMQQSSEELSNALRKKQSELDEQRKQNQAQQAELAEMKELLEKTKSELDVQWRKSTVDASANTGQQKELRQTKQTVAELESKNRQLQLELEQTQSVRTEGEAALKRKLNELQEEKASLELQMKEMMKRPTHAILQEKIDKLRAQNDTLRDEIKKRDENTAKATDRIDKYEAQIATLEKKALATTRRLEKMNKGFVDLNYHTQQRAYDLETKTLEKFESICSSIAKAEALFENLHNRAERLHSSSSQTKQQHDMMLTDYQKQKNILEFAIRVMAKLAGDTCLSAPSVEEVTRDPLLLEQYYEDLREKVEEREKQRAIPVAHVPSPVKASTVASTLSTMNQLMNMMTEQMHDEHDELMSTLAEHENRESFRSSALSERKCAIVS